MVMLAKPQPSHWNTNLGTRVTDELNAVDTRRFSHITARGLLCGFVELDGVVPSYYAKALALQTVRNIPGVHDVVDLIRVAPVREFAR